MASRERVSLLDARPELTRYVSSPDLDEVTGVSLPVVTVDGGVQELYELLRQHKAFGATVLDGIVMNSLQVGEHTGIQLLGPGDLLLEGGELMPSWLGDVESRAAGLARLDCSATSFSPPRSTGRGSSRGCMPASATSCSA